MNICHVVKRKPTTLAFVCALDQVTVHTRITNTQTKGFGDCGLGTEEG
jgi:hypothetical protein